MTRVRVPRVPLLVVFAIMLLSSSELFFMRLGSLQLSMLRGGQDDAKSSSLLLESVREESSEFNERMKVIEELLVGSNQTTERQTNQPSVNDERSNSSAKNDVIDTLNEFKSYLEGKIQDLMDASLVPVENVTRPLPTNIHNLTGGDNIVAVPSSYGSNNKTVENATRPLPTNIHNLTSGDNNEAVPSSYTYGSNNETFCVPWSVDMDDWWTHRPDWYVSHENDTHYCFSPISDRKKAQFFRELYDIQFNGDCSKRFVKKMFSTGWGADIGNVLDGLNYAKLNNRPFQLHTHIWLYVVYGKDFEQSVCPRRNMFCYFLNLTSCETNFTGKELHKGRMTKRMLVFVQPASWYREYATRQRTWLRRAVYDYTKKNLNLTTPCTAMHVRRADVVLHRKHSRRYHAIEEYVEAMDNRTNNILLLTDDHNAIGEARTKFPNYNWMYFDRPRHKGSEGGFENQIPSQDPKHEVIVLMAIFQSVRKCTQLVHSTSGLAHHMQAEMQSAHSNPTLKVINIDTGVQGVKGHHNRGSVNISRAYTVE